LEDFIMKYWIEFGFGILILAGGVVTKWLRCRMMDSETIKRATVAMLRHDIINIFHFYEYRNNKVFPIYARESLDDLFTQYTALGGNGAIKGLVQIMNTWPITKELEPAQDLRNPTQAQIENRTADEKEIRDSMKAEAKRE
jgi:hypothetical protein